MKKKAIALILIAMLSIPLFADVFDISLTVGQENYKWPQNGISFSYGANFGLTKRLEMNVYGISEATPKPFESNMFGLDFSYAILGRRTSGTKISGSGINMLLSLGGFYRTDDNGAGLLMSFTPLTVGNPITGRRERLAKVGAGWDFVNNKLVVTFSLMNLDYYVRGSYRDYPY